MTDGGRLVRVDKFVGHLAHAVLPRHAADLEATERATDAKIKGIDVPPEGHRAGGALIVHIIRLNIDIRPPQRGPNVVFASGKNHFIGDHGVADSSDHARGVGNGGLAVVGAGDILVVMREPGEAVYRKVRLVSLLELAFRVSKYVEPSESFSRLTINLPAGRALPGSVQLEMGSQYVLMASCSG